MLDPVRLVADLFQEKNLSYNDLQAFSHDFLFRLARPENNPGGIYNQLLTDTTNRHQEYFGKVVDKLTKQAEQKGTTVTTKQALARVYKALRKMHGLVRFEFGKGSEEYGEFFPRTMQEYYKAPVDNLGALLDRFIKVANLHLLADYPAEVANFINVKNQFSAARSAQESMFSEVKSISTGRHERRKALTLQLTKSFLLIAADHLENPDRFKDYYDARFLPIRKAK